MNTLTKGVCALPKLIELPEPQSPPIYPEAATGQLSEQEVLEWSWNVLQLNIKQLEHGDGQAAIWFESTDVKNPMSFINVCRLIGVDPERMYEAIYDAIPRRAKQRTDDKESSQ